MFIPLVSFSQTFCDGWEAGYEKGLESCMKMGLAPTCPIPKMLADTYGDGYGLGYKKAKEKCNDEDSSSSSGAYTNPKVYMPEEESPFMKGFNQGIKQTSQMIQNNQPPQSIVQNSINDWSKEGRVYIGDGKHKFVTVGKSSAVSIKKIRKRAINEIEFFAKNRNLTYKIIEETIRDRRLNVLLGIVTITIETYNIDGSLALNRDEVAKRIIQLKELLDLDIITQQEYDKKAASLKKLLLDN